MLYEVITDFELGIRPEDMALADGIQAQFLGRLVDVEPLGLKSVLTVETDTDGTPCPLRLLAESKQVRTLQTGQNVGICLPNPERLRNNFV